MRDASALTVNANGTTPSRARVLVRTVIRAHPLSSISLCVRDAAEAGSGGWWVRTSLFGRVSEMSRVSEHLWRGCFKAVAVQVVNGLNACLWERCNAV